MKYCKFCGNQLFEEAVICPKCNNSLIDSYTIKLQSEKQFVIGKIVFDIKVDDKDVYSINAGENLELELPAGIHKLQFNIKFRSKTISVDLNRNVNLHIEWDRFTGGVSVFEV